MEINSNQQPSSSSVSGSLSNAQRPGEYLRQMRIVQKRELSEVARELSMPERQLIALESDDYKSLPEPAFIKGYLRAYAKLLGADSNNLIHRFDEMYTNDTGLPTNHALENSPIKALGRLQRGRKAKLGWLKWVLLLVIVVLLVWALIAGISAWRHKHQTTAPEKPESEAAVLPTENAPTILDVPTAPANAHDQLSLTFAHPVNVSIQDSTGKTLASGRQTQPLKVEGDSPFSIRLDDAAAVSLTFNQEQISLTPYTVNGKAEFRLSR